jgi:hypothetical protein
MPSARPSQQKASPGAVGSALDEAHPMMPMVPAPFEQRVANPAEVGVEFRLVPMAVRELDPMGMRGLHRAARHDRRLPGDGLRVQHRDGIDVVGPAGATSAAAARAKRAGQAPPGRLFPRGDAPVGRIRQLDRAAEQRGPVLPPGEPSRGAGIVGHLKHRKPDILRFRTACHSKDAAERKRDQERHSGCWMRHRRPRLRRDRSTTPDRAAVAK